MLQLLHLLIAPRILQLLEKASNAGGIEGQIDPQREETECEVARLVCVVSRG